MDSAHAKAREYTSQLVDTGLHCTSEEDEKRFALDDVLCVLPQSADQRSGYKVLFLQRHSRADPTREYERLESIWTASLPPAVLSERLCTAIPAHLDVERGANLHIILSSGSGTGMAGVAHDNYHNLVQPLFSFLSVTGYKVHETTSAQTITDLARSEFLNHAKAGAAQTIILLSGDGGLVDIVDVFYNDGTAALRTPPNIALIPSGTGNAMANSIGLLDQPITGLMALLRGKPVPIPVFRATFSPGSQLITADDDTKTTINQNGLTNPTIYGAVVASWGIHAALVADSDTPEYRKFGSERFKMAIKELLFPSTGDKTHKYHGIITLTLCDPATREMYTAPLGQDNKHMYMLATSVPNLERNFVISPDSKALDGRLRIVYFGPMPPSEVVDIMSLAYQNGKHTQSKDVTYTEVEGFKIEFREELEKWRRVCIDGKIIVVSRDGWVDVEKDRRHLLRLITL